jgi:hypothetical protein
MFFPYDLPLPDPAQIQVLTAADPDWKDKPLVPQPPKLPPPPSPGRRKGTRAANISDSIVLHEGSLSEYPPVRRS